MEGAWRKKSKSLVSLSEQQLVDCVYEESRDGCDGGSTSTAIQWAIDNPQYGMASEAAYSYRGDGDGSCHHHYGTVARFTGMVRVERDSEDDLKDAVGNVGPVAVAIDADHHSFMHYDSGVFTEDHCSSSHLDHAVTVIGYGHEDGKDFWLVKNSWGDDWGEDGYIKMQRNYNNMCGIAHSAKYAVA